jgi:hypothetical protein
MTNATQPPTFRNMNDLTTYLIAVETRLATLESENKIIRNQLGQVKYKTDSQIFKTEQGLPNTGLISDSFLMRAFTVWGHYFVAQLIIAIPMFICYMIFVFTLMSKMNN